MDWRIPLFKLSYDDQELAATQEVLASQWLTMGPRTAQFEESFAVYLGGGVRAYALSSCTAALHLALLACGVGPGDEVVVPALTFVAAVNVVRIVGATPVLADCTSLDDWNVSAETIEKQLTGKTRAVVIVHFAGEPCEMDGIKARTAQGGVPLIEDCAHAVGGSWRGQRCGTFGDVGCFSFFSNKNLSTGEGGMAVTADPAIADRLRLLRSHGMTSLTIDRHQRKSISYDVLQPGLNYRIDEIRSALGTVQLGKLDLLNGLRREAARVYRDRLRELDVVAVPWSSERAGVNPVHHIFPVLLPPEADRTRVIGLLAERGIQTSIHYPAFRDFTAYRGAGLAESPVAEEISRRVLTLPLYPGLSAGEIDEVCSALGDALYE